MRFAVVYGYSFLSFLAVLTIGWGVPVHAKDECEIAVENKPAPVKHKPMLELERLAVSYDGIVTWNGVVVVMTVEPQQRNVLLRVLFALTDQPGKVFSSEELYKEAWIGESERSAATLALEVENAVDQLSRAIRGVDEGFQRIFHTSGGYSWGEPGSENFGLATINKTERKLFWRGQPVELRLREFRVAEKLIRNPGKAFTFIELFEAYSGEPYNEDRDDWDTYNIVKVVLSRIRKQIRVKDSTFAAVKTVSPKVWAWDDGTRANKIVRGKLTLYPDLSEAYWGGQKVDFNQSSYRLVEYLVKKGKECTNEELYLVHTGLKFIEVPEDRLTRTMNTKFYRLRMDFESIDPKFKSIHTVWGFGYEWKD